TSFVMLAMTLTGNFLGAVTISTVARLLVYASTCAALPVLRTKTAVSPALFVVPGGSGIALAALAVCAWLLSRSPIGELTPLLAAVAAGLIFYGFSRRYGFSRKRV